MPACDHKLQDISWRCYQNGCKCTEPMGKNYHKMESVVQGHWRNLRANIFGGATDAQDGAAQEKYRTTPINLVTTEPATRKGTSPDNEEPTSLAVHSHTFLDCGWRS